MERVNSSSEKMTKPTDIAVAKEPYCDITMNIVVRTCSCLILLGLAYGVSVRL